MVFRIERRIWKKEVTMRYLKYLALLAVLMLPLAYLHNPRKPGSG